MEVALFFHIVPVIFIVFLNFLPLFLFYFFNLSMAAVFSEKILFIFTHTTLVSFWIILQKKAQFYHFTLFRMTEIPKNVCIAIRKKTVRIINAAESRLYIFLPKFRQHGEAHGSKAGHTAHQIGNRCCPEYAVHPQSADPYSFAVTCVRLSLESH